MKLPLVFAILLNLHRVLAEPHLFNKPPREFQEQAQRNSHPRHKHHPHHHPHHNHQHDDYVNKITVDDLANDILSLPGSLSKQAYETFLSLGEFIPADTKAHKFFTAIPKSIKRKSNDEILELHTFSPEQSTVDPIFIVQPAGYHTMQLPLHPISSLFPYNYVTRVPCRHTESIHVPLHTFDIQISATAHRSEPVQNFYNDSDNGDDFDSNAAFKVSLDLISADTDANFKGENPEDFIPVPDEEPSTHAEKKLLDGSSKTKPPAPPSFAQEPAHRWSFASTPAPAPSPDPPAFAMGPAADRWSNTPAPAQAFAPGPSPAPLPFAPAPAPQYSAPGPLPGPQLFAPAPAPAPSPAPPYFELGSLPAPGPLYSVPGPSPAPAPPAFAPAPAPAPAPPSFELGSSPAPGPLYSVPGPSPSPAPAPPAFAPGPAPSPAPLSFAQGPIPGP